MSFFILLARQVLVRRTHDTWLSPACVILDLALEKPSQDFYRNVTYFRLGTGLFVIRLFLF